MGKDGQRWAIIRRLGAEVYEDKSVMHTYKFRHPLIRRHLLFVASEGVRGKFPFLVSSCILRITLNKRLRRRLLTKSMLVQFVKSLSDTDPCRAVC